MDNITFSNWCGHTTSYISYGIGVIDNMFGVFDHNNIAGTGCTYLALIEFSHSSYLGVGQWGDNSWAQSENYGSANFIFFENNTFNAAGCCDNEGSVSGQQTEEGGGRIVQRFNKFTNMDHLNSALAWHGTESNGRPRGARAFEQYGNTFTVAASTESAGGLLGGRSGTGLMFGNTADISASGANIDGLFSVTTPRTNASIGGWGACDGASVYDTNDGVTYYSGTISTVTGVYPAVTVTVTGSPGWTTNQWIPAGAPYSMHDVTLNDGTEIISNTANTLVINVGSGGPGDWTPVNGDSIQILRASACVDQGMGRGAGFLYTGANGGNSATPLSSSAQAASPSYAWNNAVIGGSPIYYYLQASSKRIIANRDFYVDTLGQSAQTTSSSPFDGTSGNGFGTKARRPAACTTGVGYFATDEGSWNTSGNGFGNGNLYLCTSTNTWTLSYTPYTYPHPLTVQNPCAGPFTISSQEPSTCMPYPGGLYTTQLPGAGSGGPTGHLIANSAAMVTLLTGEVGQSQVFKESVGSASTANPNVNNPNSNSANNSNPTFYGQSSDPVWTFTNCQAVGTTCGSDMHNGFTAHIPVGAHFSYLTSCTNPGCGGDSFFDLWDQTNNEYIRLHGNNEQGITFYNKRYFNMSNCCTLDLQFLDTAIATIRSPGAFSTPDYGQPNGYSIDSRLASTDLRHHEVVAGSIQHALITNSYCVNDSLGSNSYVFPSPRVSILGCTSVMVSNTNRPFQGQLFFLDYTDAQIAALSIPSWKKPFITALAHYGIYFSDTCGTPCFEIVEREGDEAYSVAGIANPFFTWATANSVPCRNGGGVTDAPTNTCEVYPLSDLPAGWETHIHVADQCVPKGMVRLAGGCGPLVFTIQPSNTGSGSTMATVKVTYPDATFTGNTTLTVTSCPGVSATNNTQPNTAGVATFSIMNMTGSGSNCTFVASASGADNTTSNTFNVGAALSFTVQPATTVSGMTMASFTVTDSDNTFSGTVTLTANGCGAGFTNTSGSATAGVKVFSTVGTSASGSGCNFTASASGASNAVSNLFDITPAPAQPSHRGTIFILHK
jgi:hypothetical protein